jgi:hypothetical protein
MRDEQIPLSPCQLVIYQDLGFRVSGFGFSNFDLYLQAVNDLPQFSHRFCGKNQDTMTG